MTVADNTSRNQYTATSGQTVFAYTFEIVDKDDVVVLKNGTTLSEGTDYTVSNVGNDSGGNVTLTVGATASDVLTLYRDMPYSRTQNYTNSGDFLASEVNSDFDNLWLAGEQTNRAFSQSIRKPITDSDSISMELPEAASRVDSFLTFDSTGAVSTSPLSSGLSPSIIARQQFTGNGSTTAFTLAADPGSPAGVVIYIDGVYQEEDTYSVSGSTVTFTEAPPTNASIEVVSYKTTAVGTTDANSVTYLPAGTGAVQTTVQTKLRESVSVKDFGAVGDGVTDDTAAIQAALDSGAIRVLIPKGTYILSDQLNPATSQIIDGYGATLKWTKFGSVLATTASEAAQTGNGIRLLSGCELLGLNLELDNVPSPSGISISPSIFSGAFWNVIALGHFNDATTPDMSIATSNILIRDIKCSVLSGDYYGSVLGAGYLHTILIENFDIDSGLAANTDSYGMEFTWGGSGSDTWHPYGIILNDIKCRGANLSQFEGLRFSGCYDVFIDGYRAAECKQGLTVYIGDPGTNPVWGNSVQDSSRIGTGIFATDIIIEKFDVGVQILGDGQGSTHTDRKTNTVDFTLSNFLLIGNGATTNTVPWGANVGIYANSAKGYRISSGTIRECYEAGIQNTASTGGAFTTPDNVTIQNLYIYNIGRSGVSLENLEKSILRNLRIHNTNESGATPNASISITDTSLCTIIDCDLGIAGDSTRYSIQASGSSSNNNVIRTNTYQYSAGLYVTSADDQLIIYGDCTDTGGASIGASRFASVKSLLNIGLNVGVVSISSGVATIDASNAYIDTEASAASDDLTDIVVPNKKMGDMIFLTPASSSRTVNVRHAAGASGTSVRTKSGATEAMTKGFTIFIYDGYDWYKTN